MNILTQCTQAADHSVRLKRDLDLTDLEYLIDYIYYSNTTILNIPVPTIPSQLLDLINDLFTKLGRLNGFFSYIWYGASVFSAVGDLLSFLQIGEVQAAIERLYENFTVQQLISQLSSISVARETILEVYSSQFIFNGVLYHEGAVNEALLESINTLLTINITNLPLEDPLQLLESVLPSIQTIFKSSVADVNRVIGSVVTAYQSATGSSFNLDEVNLNEKEYWSNLTYFIDSTIDAYFALDTSIIEETNVGSLAEFINLAYAPKGDSEDWSEFEDFQFWLTTLVMEIHNDANVEVNTFVNINKYSPTQLLTFSLATFPNLIVFVPVFGMQLYNEINAVIEQRIIQIVTFDLSTCDESGNVLCSNQELVEEIQREGSELNTMKIIPEVVCLDDISFSFLIFSTKEGDACSTGRIDFYKETYFQSNNSDYIALFMVDFITEQLDSYLGLSTSLVYDELLTVYCFSRSECDLFDYDIETHSFLGIVTKARSNPSDLFREVNEECLMDLTAYRQYPFAFWDSWGKVLLPGLLDGNLKSWGRSDECLRQEFNVNITGMESSSHKIKSDYCLGQFNIPIFPLPFEQGICIPNTCKSDDVNSIASAIYNSFLSVQLTVTNIRLVIDLITFGQNYPTLR